MIQLGNGKNSKRGMLSIEMIGILAIIALIVVGAVVYISMMRKDSQTSDFIEKANIVVMKAKELYSDGFDATAAAGIPAKLQSLSKIKNPWDKGGADDFKIETDETDKTIDLIVSNVPEDSCMKILTSAKNSGLWTNWYLGTETSKDAKPSDCTDDAKITLRVKVAPGS